MTAPRGARSGHTRVYRPVGLYELAKIAALDFRAFPPRLPEQPVFYPVMNRPYAEEIASRWDPPDPNRGFAGFVTAFDVDDTELARHPVRVAGADRHRELWVPAEEQARFQEAFAGPIVVLAAWAGERLSECLPSWVGQPGRVAEHELAALVRAVVEGPTVGRALSAFDGDEVG